MPDYIHKPSIGNSDSCQKTLTEIGKTLYRLWREEKIASHGNYIFYIKEDILPYLQASDYEQLTQDRFPFLITRITENKQSGLDLEALMKSMDFEVLQNPITSTAPAQSTPTSIPQNQT